MKKLNVHDVAGLVRYAIREGLITPLTRVFSRLHLGFWPGSPHQRRRHIQRTMPSSDALRPLARRASRRHGDMAQPGAREHA